MGRNKKSEKSPKINVALKKKLAAVVEQKPVLWKLSHPKYKNKDVRDASWKSVAEEVGLEDDICKKTWKTLVDSLRYHKKKAQGKSGDGLSDAECSEGETKDKQMPMEAWEMWDSMKFYSEGKPQRKTLSSLLENPETNDEDNGINRNEADHSPQSPEAQSSNQMDTNLSACRTTEESNFGLGTVTDQGIASSSKVYDYACPKRKEVVTKVDSDTDKLVSSLSSFLTAKQSAIEQRLSAKPATLQYLSIYTNLDRILSKLPENVVEDLNMQFMTLAHAELKKQETAHIFYVQN